MEDIKSTTEDMWAESMKDFCGRGLKDYGSRRDTKTQSILDRQTAILDIAKILNSQRSAALIVLISFPMNKRNILYYPLLLQ